MPLPLPTNRTTANTAAEHVADHNDIHAAVNSMVTSSNLAATMAGGTVLGTFLNLTGMPYYIYADSQTTWPDNGARVVPAGFNGRVIWDSQAYPGHAQPPGMQENPVADFWDDRVA